MHGWLAKVATGLLAASVCCLALPQDTTSNIVFEAETLTLNGETNVFRLTRAQITQGAIRVEADEALATALDFDDQTKWEFTGNVRINFDGVVLDAASAVFVFMNQRIAEFDVRGNPASIEDRSPKRRRPVRGTATNLDYDYADRTLHMSGDATLYRGQSVIRSCSMTYDFDDESFISSPSPDCSDTRMRITVPVGEHP